VAELDVERILRELTAGGVDYVIIGGVAALLHGSATFTQDLDIFYATDDANLEALGRVLVKLKATLRGVEEDVPFVPDARTLRSVEVLTLETRAGPLDVLARPDGTRSYAAVRRRAERLDLGKIAVLVASVDDLIAMKRAAGRPKDLIAIEELEAIGELRRRRG
jgi:hypothetical protein